MKSIFDNDEIWNKFYKEVLEWIDTPFWDNQRVKGLGVDCIRFVGEAVKSIKEDFNYENVIFSPQWYVNMKEEVMYNNIIKTLKENNIKYHDIDFSENIELKRGDFLLYAIRSKYMNHTVIYLGDNKIIHSSPFRKKVIVESLSKRLLKKIIRLKEL